MTSKNLLIWVAFLFQICMGLPSKNVTITIPDGFSNHGKDNIFCVPTKWYQIFTFFAVNFVSHAATVKTRPGQMYYHKICDFLLALAFPFSGVMRAMETFIRSSWPSEDDLVKACRAGALCVVARASDLTPNDPEVTYHRYERRRDEETRYGSSRSKHKCICSFSLWPEITTAPRDQVDDMSRRHISEEIALEYLYPETSSQNKTCHSFGVSRYSQISTVHNRDEIENTPHVPLRSVRLHERWDPS